MLYNTLQPFMRSPGSSASGKVNMCRVGRVVWGFKQHPAQCFLVYLVKVKSLFTVHFRFQPIKSASNWPLDYLKQNLKTHLNFANVVYISATYHAKTLKSQTNVWPFFSKGWMRASTTSSCQLKLAGHGILIQNYPKHTGCSGRPSGQDPSESW